MKSTASPLEPKPPSPQPSDLPTLPPYLHRTEPMEVEDLPLQVSLLTMEIATQRIMLQRMSVILETAARMMQGPGLSLQEDQ